MQHGIEKLPYFFDVSNAYSELMDNSELWNDFDMRTNHPLSPHREMDDIVVRYNARENYHGDRQKFNEEHDAVWWTDKLPSVKSIANRLMKLTDGERLGMVLVTRLPAGKMCYPHIDNGWHATYYDKYAIQIKANLQQSFVVDDIHLSVNSGECYMFDNSRPHWVTNDTDEDRITLIVCIRSKSCQQVGQH